MDRPVPAALLLLVFVTLLAPVGAAAAVPAAGPGPPGAVDGDRDAPPDPEADRLGWENGYWYNESIDVDQSDGLSDRELRAIVNRTMARVEHIRRLEFTGAVPVELRSREQFRERQRNRSTAPGLRTFDNAKFEALFLINESADSIAVQNRNAGSSILGFYSPARDAIVLISDNRSTLELDELTLAHELVHALQDQHFNLSRYHARTRDQVNANDGLVEGDANYVQYRYRRRCEEGSWKGTCVTPTGGDSAGDLANIGVYFVKFQPYSDGPRFVRYLHDHRGGWPGVNAAYDDPPASTEQVIHPPKYLDDRPTTVTLHDRTTGSWERVRPPGRPDYAVLGEASVMTMFVYPLYHSSGRTRIVDPSAWLNTTAGGSISNFDPLNYESEFSAGWDGDRLHVYRNGANETAYVWRLVWDTPADAAEFYGGYERVLDYWGAEEVAPDTYRIGSGGFADAVHVIVDGDTVTIVNAPTVEDLSAVRGTITIPGLTPTPTTDTPAPGTTTAEAPTTPTTDTPAPGTTTAEAPTTPTTDTPIEEEPSTATDTSAVTTTATGTPTTTPGFGLVTVALALLAVLLALAGRTRR